MWAKAGRCEEVDATYGQISAACRKSCRACTPLYLAGQAGSEKVRVRWCFCVRNLLYSAPELLHHF